MNEVILYIILGLTAIILIYISITICRLIKAKKLVKESFGNMDVCLKKRWDLIPNLIETVKNYSTNEKKTLEEVIRLRNTTYDNMDEKKKLNTDDALKSRIPKLLALSEFYPELQTNESYKKLQTKLSEIEIDIANTRHHYNDCIKHYNNLVSLFPSSLIAKMMKFNIKENYYIENNNKNIKIDL